MADAERSEKVYRQTCLPNYAKCNYSIGALILEDYPDLYASIGRCIALLAHVDSEIGNIFSLLLGVGCSIRSVSLASAGKQPGTGS